MDLVDFWSKQVAKWNTDNKCGLCWEFHAPLTESAVNIVQSELGKECCVQVFLLRERVSAFSSNNEFNPITGLTTGITCNKGFQLLVLMEGNIGTNNFNEIKGHDTQDSKWYDILYKIEECLSCDAFLDFCTILGTQSRVTTWQGQQVINYLDKAYSGYRITVNFQNTK